MGRGSRVNVERVMMGCESVLEWPMSAAVHFNSGSTHRANQLNHSVYRKYTREVSYRSRLDYCNAVLAGLPHSTITPLHNGSWTLLPGCCVRSRLRNTDEPCTGCQSRHTSSSNSAAGVRGSQPAYVTDVIQPAIHHITLWSATNNHSAVPCRPTRLNVLSVQPLLVCGTVSRQTFTTQLHCSSPPEGNSTLLWAFHKPTTALWHRFVSFRTNCCFNIVSNRSVLHCCKRHYQIHVWAIVITQIYSLEVGRLLSLIHLTALVVSRSVRWPITWP